MANLVMGADGSTSIRGSSSALSSKLDRLRFHELRKRASVILIGGNTARNEPYAKTPLPLVILTLKNQIPDEVLANPNLEVWQLDPVEAVAKAQIEFPGNILIEGGINLLVKLLAAELIDELYLTINSQAGGENIYDLNQLTREFTITSSEKSGDDNFLILIKN